MQLFISGVHNQAIIVEYLYLQVKFIASTAAYYSNNQLIKHNENKCNQNVIEFLWV